MNSYERRIRKLGFEGVADYQRFWGLKPDGVVGRITARSVARPRFCGRPDRERLGSECPWPQTQVTWHLAAEPLHDIEVPAVRQVCLDAWGLWTARCGIEPVEVESHKEANCLIFPHFLGGPGGTLGDCQLPPCRLKENRGVQLELRLDSGEPFHPGGWPDCPEDEIPLEVVLAHELGHFLAFRHRRRGLMQPSLTPGVGEPDAEETAQAVRWYGPPKAAKPTKPPTKPDNPARRKAILSVSGFKVVSVFLDPL